jgi:hypothetical protein
VKRGSPRVSAWLLILAVVTAISMAFAQTPPKRKKGAKPAASASASAPPASASVAPPPPPPPPAPVVPAAPEVPKVYTTALAPMPGDQAVPDAFLPPGASGPDPGPSKVIFPPQKVTLRFNHKFHLKQGTTCKTCHSSAFTSDSTSDVLIPPGTACDACHSTDHSDLAKVTPGDDEPGKCGFCHRGYQPGDGNKVARLELPRANMAFTHKKHLDRNIQCGQCHGSIEQLELATRDQLPRMSGCFHCHQRDDAASQGDAKSACTTCHLREPNEGPSLSPASGGPRHVIAEAPGMNGGRMRTVFASGVLQPPRWLENAAHTPDFLQRHRMVAAADSGLCANCHKEDYCIDCHDGRVRPRSIHPGDYLSMHPVEATMAMQRCRSCHEEQSFCVTCHMRVGVSMSSPTGDRMSARFHPPKVVWSDVPVTPQHHKFQAQRNLNACVSCHTERDCVTCHGANGIGGGFDPHRPNFRSSCGVQFRRNPRPCLVCHEPTDGQLALCR